MNLTKLYNILQTVNVAGIPEVIFEKQDDGVLVRGADVVSDDQDPSIVILSKTDKDVVEMTTGVHRVSVLLNRMSLFDLQKAKVKTSDNGDDWIHHADIRQGKRKVSFTFANPSTINVPDGAVEDEVVSTVSFDKNQVQDLVKANQALSPELFKLKGEGEDIVIELFDGISDNFTDVVGTNSSGEWSYSWRTDSIMKLVKHTIKSSDAVELGIGKSGILYIAVGELIFMIMPQVE